MSLLPRTPEPEVMDSEQEARDYDAMDHGDVNASFCVDLLAIRPRPRVVLDAGTGTALIAIELCRRTPEARIEAIDLGDHMLARATRNVERAGMGGRIGVAKMDAKATRWPAGAFDTVLSNSLAHHVPDPRALFAEQYAPLPDVDASSEVGARHARQRALFVASLHAALTADEVRAMVAPLGIPAGAVRMTSDRHWTLSHVRS
jgi:SAM-dependent methyltransferase